MAALKTFSKKLYQNNKMSLTLDPPVSLGILCDWVILSD